jgi:hypothetical protein
MSQSNPLYLNSPLRVIQNQGKTWEAPHVVQGQPANRWLQGDIVELARVDTPNDGFSRLVKFEYDFRDLNYAVLPYETVKASIFGRLKETDLKFFLVWAHSQIVNPWFVNVGAAPDGLQGFPGVPFPAIDGANAYQWSSQDNRELPVPIPLPAGTTIILIARFYNDIIYDGTPATVRFQQYQNASLAGRIVIEHSGENLFSDQRAKGGPR